MSARNIGPASLFNITVDHICDGVEELPDFTGFPESVVQQIMNRILSRQNTHVALKLLSQHNILSSLEIPANMVINDEWLKTLGTQACSLEELTVADCTDVTFEGLFELQQLTNLRRMHLYKLPLLGAETAHIIESMPYLTDLHLEGVQGCIVLNEALCASLGCLARLKHLALVGATGLNAQHCAQVAEKLPQLEIMNMSDSDIEDNGLICLLKPLKQLQSISLKGCAMLTDACAQALAALPRLQTLDLARTSLSDIGLSLLKSLENLEKLSLCGTKVTDTSLKVINSSMQTLTELDLSCKKVTDRGLQQLGNLSKLRTLNLSYTQVSDAGMTALRKLPKLSSLSLRWTRISDWALGALTNSPEAQQAKHALDRLMGISAPALQSPIAPESSGLALSRGTSSTTLPLRRSRSSLEAVGPATMRSPAIMRRREQQARKKGLSRSGDYSQVLRRCRATMDFHAAAADEIGDEAHAPLRISEGSEHSEVEPTLLQPAQLLQCSPAVNTSAPAPQHFSQHTLPNNMGTQILSNLTPARSMCDAPESVTFPDDDGNWLDDSLNLFEEEPLYRGIEFGDGDYGIFTGPAETLGELELDSPKYRSLETAESTVDFPEAKHLGWSPQECELNSGLGHHEVVEESQADTLSEMRTLDLSVTDIADAGLTFLSAFSNITCLNLFSTKVSDDGLEHVAKLHCLIELDLCGTEVSDAGLSRLESLQSLEILKLCGNQRVTDEGAIQVLSALKALHCLELRSTAVSEECLQKVAETLGLRNKVLMA